MPIVGEAVVRTVLAHGRDHDPVAEGDCADAERAEEIDFRYFAIVIGG